MNRNRKSISTARRALPWAFALIAGLGLTACQTNPLSSSVSLKYESTQAGEYQHKLLTVDGQSGILADDVSNLSADYTMEETAYGAKLTISLNGDKKTDTGNQFRFVDSIVGLFLGLFAGGVAP